MKAAVRSLPEPVKDVLRRLRTSARRRLGGLRSVETLEWQLGRILEAQRVNCVLDVGAHEGEYGRLLRQLGYHGPIVSFEPVRDHYSALERQARGDANWRPLPIALGDQRCSTEINVTSTGHFSSFLRPSAYSSVVFKGHSDIVRTEAVPMRRLDEALSEAGIDVGPKRAFLKLDTQGFDLKVIEGAGRVLDSVVGLQSEISVKPLYEGCPDLSQSLETFRHYGFELAGLFPVVRDREGRIIELDCLMVRLT